jgi:hypothetical protein
MDVCNKNDLIICNGVNRYFTSNSQLYVYFAKLKSLLVLTSL